MKITKDSCTGNYSCIFQKNKRYYRANLENTFDYGPICTIFASDCKGLINNWIEVYVKLYPTLSEANIRNSVNEFLTM